MEYLVEMECCVVALSEHLKFCQDLIDRHRDELVNYSASCLGAGKPVD